MDIIVDDSPTLQVGDIIIPDELLSGFKFQICKCDGRVIVHGRQYEHLYGLYDLDKYTIKKTFTSLSDLETFVYSHGKSTVRKSSEYFISLKRKV